MLILMIHELDTLFSRLVVDQKYKMQREIIVQRFLYQTFHFEFYISLKKILERSIVVE